MHKKEQDAERSFSAISDTDKKQEKLRVSFMIRRFLFHKKS